LRLHQVCNGFVKMDNQEITVFENCPKLKELIEIIEEADGKFIIWANYVHNIESIVDKLKKTYGC
jgi:hypothetical protein